MAEEESVSENNPNINSVNLSVGRPYRVTMEFPLLFSMLSVSLAGAAISNILLYRTCIHSLNHTKEECQIFLSPVKTNVTPPLEEEVQKYTAFVNMVRTIIESVAPAFFSLFLGVWSDTHGRKPLVIWPLFGMSISSIMMVVYSMMDGLNPWWFIATTVPASLAGGYTALFTGAFCYISDITSTDKRSLRMTILEASVSMGSVIGGMASSYVLRAMGNTHLLLIAATLPVAAYVFTNVFLSESLVGATPGGLKSVLDFTLVKEMLDKCFKVRPSHGRAQVLLLTVANSLSIFIMYGLLNLDYLYSRQKVHWAITQYTMFSAAHTTITFCGSFVGVILVQKLFGVSDLAFSIIAFLSSTSEYVVRAFATVSWHMYFGAGIALFSGLSAPLIRSLITKIVPSEDIAKVFALMCAIEGISPLVSPVIYSSLYEYTISTFPGAIYLLSGVITVMCAVSLGFVQYYRRNTTSIVYENLTEES